MKEPSNQIEFNFSLQDAAANIANNDREIMSMISLGIIDDNTTFMSDEEVLADVNLEYNQGTAYYALFTYSDINKFNSCLGVLLRKGKEISWLNRHNYYLILEVEDRPSWILNKNITYPANIDSVICLNDGNTITLSNLIVAKKL